MAQAWTLDSHLIDTLNAALAGILTCRKLFPIKRWYKLVNSALIGISRILFIMLLLVNHLWSNLKEKETLKFHSDPLSALTARKLTSITVRMKASECILAMSWEMRTTTITITIFLYVSSMLYFFLFLWGSYYFYIHFTDGRIGA